MLRAECDFAEFAALVQQAFALAAPAAIVLSASGALIDNPEWVRDGDVLYVVVSDALVSGGDMGDVSPPAAVTPPRGAVSSGGAAGGSSLPTATAAAVAAAAKSARDGARVTLMTNESTARRSVQTLVPDTMAALLALASARFGIDARVVYNEGGAHVLEIETVRNDDVLYVADASQPEFWKTRPSLVAVVSQRLAREQTEDEDADSTFASDEGSLSIRETPVSMATALAMGGALGRSGGAEPFLDHHGDSAAAPSEWVMLNVGGQVFQTSRSTLCRDASSMLARLFGTTRSGLDGESYAWSSAIDRNGAFLFDRDPSYFGPLLNYLRTGTVIVPPDVSLEGLLQEALFFQITGLVDVLHQRMLSQHSPSMEAKRSHYVVLTVKPGGIKLIEGPVEDVMTTLNGGKTPPRKPPFSKESDDLHTRVYGLTELGWLLKNFKLCEVLDSLLEEGWVLIESSAAYSSCSIGPGTVTARGSDDATTEHIFIFAHRSGMASWSSADGATAMPLPLAAAATVAAGSPRATRRASGGAAATTLGEPRAPAREAPAREAQPPRR